MAAATIDFRNPQYYINRELSWLEFDRRCLSEARNKENPLFERLKFLSITASNLDEFFQVRVASLQDMVNAGYKKKDIAGMSASEQLTAVLSATQVFMQQQYYTLNRQLIPALEEQGLVMVRDLDTLSKSESRFVEEYFSSNVFPVLTPMAVDSSRPFPLIRNKSLNIGALLVRKETAAPGILGTGKKAKKGAKAGKDNKDNKVKYEFATVQVPSVLPRILLLPRTEGEPRRLVLLEDVIRQYLPMLFVNYEVKCSSPYRIMRSADLDIAEDEAEDLLKEIQKQLKKRLSEDDDAVGNEYWNNGYLFYSLDPAEINIVGDSIDLEMRIFEGQQAHISHVRINGNNRLYENVVRRELRTKPGDLFSKEALMRSARELASMGHFDPEKVNPDVKPNPEDGTVDINWDLEQKSNDQIEFSLGWGQTGVIGKIGLKLNNFSMANLFNKNKEHRGIMPIGDGETLSIGAQTNGTYYQSYNAGYTTGWLGGKRPLQFSVNAFYSKQTDVNSNYYNQSYLNNYYNYLYGYNSYNSGMYNYQNYYDPDTFIKLFGASVGIGKRLRWPDDYFMLSMSLSYTRYMLKNWKYFLVTNGNCNNLNFGINLSRTSTDNQLFPRRGSEFDLSLSITPPWSAFDGKDYHNLANNSKSSTFQKEQQEKYRWIEYHKWKFKSRTYTALTGGAKCFVLMSRVEMGILGSYNYDKKSPFETFYMGGDGMSGYSTGYAEETIGLRGYENGSLTPYYQEGYAYDRFSLELRYPFMLGNTTIYGLTFAEAGNAWNDVKKFNPFDLKRSAGVGVRIFLPMVGLMGIDWAYGFDKVFGTKGGSHFHFILGQEF